MREQGLEFYVGQRCYQRCNLSIYLKLGKLVTHSSQLQHHYLRELPHDQKRKIYAPRATLSDSISQVRCKSLKLQILIRNLLQIYFD